MCTRMAEVKKMTVPSVGKDYGATGTLMHHYSGSVKQYKHYMKRSCSFSKTEHIPHYDPAISTYDPRYLLLCIYSRKMKSHIHKKTCTRMFVAVLFIIARSGNHSDAHQTVNK